MAQTQKRGLGRGLDALLSAEETFSPAVEPKEQKTPPAEPEHAPSSLSENQKTSSEGRLTRLPIAQLRPGVHQPRVDFGDSEMSELAESVRIHGILQPILVKPSNGGYEIVAGERRWRAARQAGLEEVPTIVIGAAGEKALEIAVIENIQRSDLNPMEEAAAYENMMERLSLTQEEVAVRVGKNRSTVANYLRLLRLPEAVQESLAGGDLSMGHARALLSLRSEEEMMPLVRETEKKRALRQATRSARSKAAFEIRTQRGESKAACLILRPDRTAGDLSQGDRRPASGEVGRKSFYSGRRKKGTGGHRILFGRHAGEYC